MSPLLVIVGKEVRCVVQDERLQQGHIVVGHEYTLGKRKGLDQHVGLFMSHHISSIPLLPASSILSFFGVCSLTVFGSNALPDDTCRYRRRTSRAYAHWQQARLLVVANADATDRADSECKTGSSVD